MLLKDVTSLLIVSLKILLRSKFEFYFETGLELVTLEIEEHTGEILDFGLFSKLV